MRRFTQRLGLCLSTAILSMSLITAPAHAQSDTELLQKILTTLNNIGSMTNNTILTTVSVVAELLYTQTPGIYGTIAANQNVALAQAAELENTQESMQAFLTQLLSPTATQPTTGLYELLPGLGNTSSTTDPNAALNNFSMTALTGKPGFEDDTAKQAAENFIKLMANMDNTPKTLTASTLSQPSAAQKNYLTRLATFVAIQSVALNNLYQMYNNRVVQTGLGSQVGMVKLTENSANSNTKVGAAVSDASPMQVKQYLAQRRVKNAAWFEEMEKAAPANVDREMLYVLAEMREELFEQRLMYEQMLATMSALQLEIGQFLATQTLAQVPTN